jgi:flagellar hook-associated protein 2
MTRESNVVTDAVSGVTLTLQEAEAGVTTAVEVARSAKDATTALNGFVKAYNDVVEFVKKQSIVTVGSGEKPALYGDSSLTGTRAALSTSLLASVSDAVTDLATASSVGISFAKDGKLSLDSAKFETAFNSRFNDVEKLFAVLRSSTDGEVTVAGSTYQTAAGTYAVDITIPATVAGATGAALLGPLGTYIDDGTSDTMTVTDKATGFTAQVTLSNGMTANDIAGALNTAFAALAKRTVAAPTAYYGNLAGTVAMTVSTKWADLRAAGGASLGVATGDTISYAGTRAGGAAFTGTFSVSDAATGTVGDLVAQVQADFGTEVTVSVSGGKISVEAAKTGASSIGLTVTANNQGGGSLVFGEFPVSVVGKGLMEVTATVLSSGLVLSHRSYGSASGFTVAFAGGGADGTAQLGITAQGYAGTDVAGTIGGFVATGTGQTLVGASGTLVAGLTLVYKGTAARLAGTATVTAGLGEIVGRLADSWLDATSGLFQNKATTLSAQATRLTAQAEDRQARLDRRRAALVTKFTKMEQAVAKLQSQSLSLTSTMARLGSVA